MPPVRIAREADKPFPRRDELGDTDERLWPEFAGKPSDPWMQCLELLLIDRETGRPIIFSTATRTGRPAVEDLCRSITFRRRVLGPKARPVIKLKAGTIQARVGPVLVPQFEVIDWVDAVQMPEVAPSQLKADMTTHIQQPPIGPDVKTAGLGNPPKGKKTPPLPWKDDLDDEIPRDIG
jgi:hypothetical protein